MNSPRNLSLPPAPPQTLDLPLARYLDQTPDQMLQQRVFRSLEEALSQPVHARRPTEDLKMQPDVIAGPPNANLTSEGFTDRQLRVEVTEKECVAEWVACELPLTDSAGVILDAGSHCLEMWKTIVRQIKQGLLNFPTIYTNSYLVLDYLKQNAAQPNVAGAKINILGSLFDKNNLAFYEGDIKERLLSPSFRASHVFIGISGIEFDRAGHFSVANHGGASVLQVKELLFCRQAQMRIILATPRKIGRAYGDVFDVLSIKDMNVAPPIYLVTTPPQNPDDAGRFHENLACFRALRERRPDLSLHWITVTRTAGKGLHVVEELSCWTRSTTGNGGAKRD
jgi:DeoR/GlpR family transcriptional regulator of sugar metabolism